MNTPGRLARLACALSALACVFFSALPSHAADKVVLGLDWQALGRHAGFFVAKANGFYDREGLDVDIQRGYGAADSSNAWREGNPRSPSAITARSSWRELRESRSRPLR